MCSGGSGWLGTGGSGCWIVDSGGGGWLGTGAGGSGWFGMKSVAIRFVKRAFKISSPINSRKLRSSRSIAARTSS